MRDVTTALAVVGAASAWYFVVAYWWITRGDWRHNPGGRHVMHMPANLGRLMTRIVAARLWPDYIGRPVITLVAFAALVAQLVWRIVLMHRAQRREPARTRAPGR